jgi:hypothetical protein
MSESEAGRFLEEKAATAAHLKERTILGQQQWQIEDPHCVLVMKQDGRKMVCVTVLPEAEGCESIEDDHGNLVSVPRARRQRR